MTTLVLVLLVLLLLIAGGVAYGVRHRRSRQGGVIGVRRGAGHSSRSSR